LRGLKRSELSVDSAGKSEHVSNLGPAKAPALIAARETLLTINRESSHVPLPPPGSIGALELAFHFFVHSGAAVIGAIGIHIYCALERARGRFASGGLRPWRNATICHDGDRSVCHPPEWDGTQLNSIKTLAPITVALMGIFFCAPAGAETTEERQACIGDAFRVCWAAIPDRNQVFHCLLNNRSRLNPACRVVMDQYRRPHRITRSTRNTRIE
jgi:hypothetical protein